MWFSFCVNHLRHAAWWCLRSLGWNLTVQVQEEWTRDNCMLSADRLENSARCLFVVSNIWLYWAYWHSCPTIFKREPAIYALSSELIEPELTCQSVTASDKSAGLRSTGLVFFLWIRVHFTSTFCRSLTTARCQCHPPFLLVLTKATIGNWVLWKDEKNTGATTHAWIHPRARCQTIFATILDSRGS